MQLPAKVYGVFATSSVFGLSPVVVLRAEDGRLLPIYVGLSEAMAINSALKKQLLPRPMTHDLLVEIISKLNAKVEKVVIDDIIDNTFYARVIIKQEEHEVEVDARPSDSIAIALRMQCPIYIEKKVLDEASHQNGKLPENYVEFDQIF